jgi:hypothetical protein
MAIQSAIFSFGLPEDIDTDQLLIYSSSSETGTYTLDSTVAYEYGESFYEYDSLNDTLWYKIQFNNSVDSESGPISEAVYGGNFAKAGPFLAVSTTYDGANYATTRDVYEYSGLTVTDVSSTKVSQALKFARSIIDYRTAEMSIDRYALFDNDVARRKYNATLQMIKLAEIHIATGHLYRTMLDDRILEDARTVSSSAENISIGSTSISGGGLSSKPETLGYLSGLADKYTNAGSAILNSLAPASIRLTPQDPSRPKSPKFKLPFNGY